MSAINMSGRDLAVWQADPRNTVTGDNGAEGRLSLHRLVQGEHLRNPHFRRKVEAFFARHSRSTHLFGKPLGGSGFSARHIALLNWGHDFRKPSSPLYDADLDWLELHPEQRRLRRGPFAR